MADRLPDLIRSLEAVPSPLTWADVEARLSDPATPPGRGRVDRRRLRRQRLLLAAVVLAVVGLVAGLATWDRNGGPTGVTTNPGPERPTTGLTPSSSIPDPTATTDVGVPTTGPATGGSRRFGVELWTGSEYLVWSGEAGANDSSSRADGWRYDPASGAVRDIALAPIAPRDTAAGVWTGSEMIVCCGRSARQGDPIYDTASAAAYDPNSDTWRQLNPPPSEAGGYAVGAAWTGTEMLVAVQLGDPNLEFAGNDGVGLFAYDPASDTWSERAKPPLGDRFGETVWTGDQFVIWASRPLQSDAGASYDPATDRWTTLPDLPEPGIDHGSVVSTGDQLVVWGLAGKSGVSTEKAETVGFRLLRGDTAWRSISPAPLPTIDPYQGTAGSQTLTADPDTGEIIVAPVTGYESGAGGVPGGPPNLLGYDANADRWRIIAPLSSAGYHPEFTVGGGLLFGTDQANPVIDDLGE